MMGMQKNLDFTLWHREAAYGAISWEESKQASMAWGLLVASVDGVSAIVKDKLVVYTSCPSLEMLRGVFISD